MKIHTIKAAFLSSILGLALYSCSIATDKSELELPIQSFVLEDILVGSNEATITLNMKDLLSSGEKTKDKIINKAKLIAVLVTNNGESGLKDISSVKLSISSDGEDFPLQNVAFRNEIKENEKSISLELVEEIELGEYLGQEEIYLTIDATYLKDIEEPQNIEVGIKFDLEVEK